MWIKNYKPYTPSRRYMIWYSFDEITTNKPYKNLVSWKKRSSWRNNKWRITARFRWWWHKKLLRKVDFRWYDKVWIPAKVESIEYDPNRSSRIVLLSYKDGEKRYTLARKWCSVWDEIINWHEWKITNWNRKQLADIPQWVSVFNLEFTPFTKGKIIKSAWAYATVVWKDDTWHILIKLPSTEIRKFNEKCRATIWQLWNENHKNIVIWKAWRQRRKWIKPHILWKSMNAVDHPHWWWEWHKSIGNKRIKSPTWRNVTPWVKTRSKKKQSNKFIVSRRKK